MHQHLKLLRRRSGSFCKTVKSDLWKLRLSPATAPNTRLTLNLYQVLRSNKKALHRTISNPWAFKPASCLYGLPSTLAKQVSLSCEVYRHIKPDREPIPNISNHKHSFIDVVQIAQSCRLPQPSETRFRQSTLPKLVRGSLKRLKTC